MGENIQVMVVDKSARRIRIWCALLFTRFVGRWSMIKVSRYRDILGELK
jgi:hypothetical protein